LNQTRGRGTWKFNNSLLRDEEFAKKVKDGIKQVIEEYECEIFISPSIIQIHTINYLMNF
jgi:triosephosphate isomerase